MFCLRGFGTHAKPKICHTFVFSLLVSGSFLPPNAHFSWQTRDCQIIPVLPSYRFTLPSEKSCAHKIESALPPPPKNPKYPPPPKTRNFMGKGFSCRKKRIFPGAHKIGAAFSGPRVADKTFYGHEDFSNSRFTNAFVMATSLLAEQHDSAFFQWCSPQKCRSYTVARALPHYTQEPPACYYRIGLRRLA